LGLTVDARSQPSPAADDEHAPGSATPAVDGDGALDRKPRKVVSVPSSAGPLPGAPIAPTKPPPRTWRSLLAEGLHPREIGIACGLGVAIGISPLPGLHYVLAISLAWLLRLNVPVVLLAANVSFGPLLVVWYALGIAIGRDLLDGEPMMSSWPHFHAHLAQAKDLHDLWLLLCNYLWPWALGTTVLMAICGPLSGVLAWLLAKSVKRGRETLTRRFQRERDRR
jgi:uncharacterized protein (DUF2062 family)